MLFSIALIFGVISVLFICINLIRLILSKLKGKDAGKPKKGLAVSLIAFVLCFTLVIVDSSKDTADNGDKTAHNYSQKAEEAFERGQYKEALEYCDKIAEEFPDTEQAESINELINKEIAQYPNLTAPELYAEYSENQIRADDNYKGNAVVVTGTITDIGRTDIGDDIYVLLDNGLNDFMSVQLNFSDEQTENISQLEKGQTIKVIGDCNGQKGIISENVLISNCIVLG